DQRPGGVVLQAGVGARAPAAALVEQGHAPAGGVEEAAHGGVDCPAGPPVQDHAGLARPRAAFLVIDLVRAAGLQPAELERLVIRKERAAALAVGAGHWGRACRWLLRV